MAYKIKDIAGAAASLRKKHEDKHFGNLLKDQTFLGLLGKLKGLPKEERAEFGKELNILRQEIESWSLMTDSSAEERVSIDLTAPFDVNVALDKRPRLLKASQGSAHPVMAEMDIVADIFLKMGFNVIESRQLDDDYHMFESLNFPVGHPARDDWDTFLTDEGLVAPAHTSTMQNRALIRFKPELDRGEDIRVVVPGRVFRNEDLDATHEHTFQQVEGICVGKSITVANLVATLNEFLNEYFSEDLEVKIQPFYFPFTEPSFEMAVERPTAMRKSNAEADRWLEVLGCGMIHPNVLKMAGIDPKEYSGFAWGFGLDRLILLKNGIEDIRHLRSGKLDFLKQFGGAL